MTTPASALRAPASRIRRRVRGAGRSVRRRAVRAGADSTTYAACVCCSSIVVGRFLWTPSRKNAESGGKSGQPGLCVRLLKRVHNVWKRCGTRRIDFARGGPATARSMTSRGAEHALKNRVDVLEVMVEVEVGGDLRLAQVLAHVRVGLEQRQKIVRFAVPHLHGVALDHA